MIANGFPFLAKPASVAVSPFVFQLTPSTVPAGTFSRASGATFETEIGTVASVGVNVLRRDHYPLDPVTGTRQRTVLIEPAATNLIPYSNMTGGSWGDFGGGNARTAAAGVAPDGTTTATRVVGSGTSYYPGSGGATTISMWVKRNAASNQTFRIFIGNGDAGQVSADLTATDTWQRFTYSSTGTNNLGGITKGAGGLAYDVLVWGVQVEAGPRATSLIPTNGATASRAADRQSFPYLGAREELTIYLRGLSMGPQPQWATLWRIGAEDVNAEGLMLYNPTTANEWTFLSKVGTDTRASSAAGPTRDQLIEARCVFKADGSVRLYTRINGGIETAAPASAALAFTSAFSAAQITLGASNGATAYVPALAYRDLKVATGERELDFFAPTYDATAIAHFTRIETDGGQISDKEFVSRFIADLKTTPVGNCYVLLDLLILPQASKLTAGTRKVAKLYDLSAAKGGNYYDATQSTEANQQTLSLTSGRRFSKSVLTCTTAGRAYFTGAIPTTPQPTHIFAVARRAATGGAQEMIIDNTGSNRNALYFQNGSTTTVSLFASVNQVPYETIGQTRFNRFVGSFVGAIGTVRANGYLLTNALSGASPGSVGTGGTYEIAGQGSSFPLNGDLAVVAVSKTALTDAQRDAIDAVIAAHFPADPVLALDFEAFADGEDNTLTSRTYGYQVWTFEGTADGPSTTIAAPVQWGPVPVNPGPGASRLWPLYAEDFENS